MGQVRPDRTTGRVRPSSNTAIASFALDFEAGAWDQPGDVGEMAEAVDGQGFKDQTEALRPTTLTKAEEAAVVAFRRHTLLPLDDGLMRCSH